MGFRVEGYRIRIFFFFCLFSFSGFLGFRIQVFGVLFGGVPYTLNPKP